MAAKSISRGHTIITKDGVNWFYEDTGKPTCNERPCKHCESAIKDDIDTCIGKLPGVKFACCGHGNREGSYIMFENGVVIRGFVLDKKENV